MQTTPLAIPGVPGPVTVQVNPWTGKRWLFFGDTEVPTKRGKFEFPGPDGRPVVATSIATLLAGALVYFLAAGAIYTAIGS